MSSRSAWRGSRPVRRDSAASRNRHERLQVIAALQTPDHRPDEADAQQADDVGQMAHRPELPSATIPRSPIEAPWKRPRSYTYRDAGVDIDAGDELVERIKPLVRRTQRPEVLAGIGGFGALVELPQALPPPGAGLRHRRRRHQAAPGHRHRPPRHHRHRPGRDVRQRCRRAGRRAAVLPRLLRHRQAAGGRRRQRDQRHRRGLRAGRLRAGRRRDRRNARHVSRRRLRPGRLLRRRGREASAIIDGTQGAAPATPSSASPPPARTPTAIRWCASSSTWPAPTQTTSSRASRCSTGCWSPRASTSKPHAGAGCGRCPCTALAHITGGGLTDNIPRVLPDGTGGACCDRARWQRDPVFDWLAAHRQHRRRRNAPHLQLRHRHGGDRARRTWLARRWHCCAAPGETRQAHRRHARGNGGVVIVNA